MEQQVITLFHESIEAKMQAGEHLAPLIAKCSHIMVNALEGGNKILTCGNGIDAAQAQIFTASLLSRFNLERPSLPAIHIGADLTTQSAIAHDFTYNEIYAKQVRALGNAEDILILINTSGNASNLLQAISAAHDKGIMVIALTGKNNRDISALLDHQDIELFIETNNSARIHEIHLLTLFCLCDLIEKQLFGSHQ